MSGAFWKNHFRSIHVIAISLLIPSIGCHEHKDPMDLVNELVKSLNTELNPPIAEPAETGYSNFDSNFQRTTESVKKDDQGQTNLLMGFLITSFLEARMSGVTNEQITGVASTRMLDLMGSTPPSQWGAMKQRWDTAVAAVPNGRQSASEAQAMVNQILVERGASGGASRGVAAQPNGFKGRPITIKNGRLASEARSLPSATPELVSFGGNKRARAAAKFESRLIVEPKPR